MGRGTGWGFRKAGRFHPAGPRVMALLAVGAFFKGLRSRGSAIPNLWGGKDKN